MITIDAEPAPITVDPARTALLMIDMQRDFLEPGGFGETLGNDVTRLAVAIGPCKAVLDRARAFYSQEGEPVVDKPGKGAFCATDLHGILRNRGIESLIVCGVTTEVCVHTTVREANDRGSRCVVPGDCGGSYFPEFREIALRMISAQGGIFGWVTDSARVPVALGDAR